MKTEKVVVYGGHGFFGRHVVEDILANTTARVTIAGRRPVWAGPHGDRVELAVSNLHDAAAVRQTVEGSQVVVHCAGPYQSHPLEPLKAALEIGAHYIDLADDRSFVRAVEKVVADKGPSQSRVFSGMSVVPGMAALFTEALREDLESVTSVRSFIAPGTGRSRGGATFVSVLSGMGTTFQMPRGGQEIAVRGWSEGEWVHFPPPCGWRLQYIAIPVADFDIMPRLFGAGTVEFRAGSDVAMFNRLAAVIAWIRSILGFPNLARFVPILGVLLFFAGFFGNDDGAVLVEVKGLRDGTEVCKKMALTSIGEGYKMPSVLAAMAVAALLRGDVEETGMVPLDKWLTPDFLCKELGRRNLTLWKSERNNDWVKWTVKAQ